MLPLPPEDCPDSEEVASFLDGAIRLPERAALVNHLVDCLPCFRILCDTTQTLCRLEQEETPTGNSSTGRPTC